MVDGSITIKRLPQARRLRLRVLPDGKTILTAPLIVSDRLINQFISQHREWLNTARGRTAKDRHLLTTQTDRLIWRGRSLPFRLAVHPSHRGRVQLLSDQLLVESPTEEASVVRNLLERWLAKQARDYLPGRASLLADLVDLTIKRTVVRSARTRWGSCSRRAAISLNWRLILAPDWVSDYVIYHELAHLTHPNHSPRFWRLVASWCPKFKEAKQWLNENHRLLHF